MSKQINLKTKFKFEWAEGHSNITNEYVEKELSLAEFIYIITKRHHEIALENVMDGIYGCYDKHKCWVKYDDNSDWEVLDRLDLGNDEDFVWIRKTIMEHFSKEFDFYWSDAVREGKEMWELREDGLEDLPKRLRDWVKYERVRMSGEYNMYMEAKDACDKAGLSLEDYRIVQDHYADWAEEAIEKLGRDKIKELTEEK